MKKILFVLPFVFCLFCCQHTTNDRIDRKAVVERHKVVSVSDNPQSPAQVGNGEFAFGVDITGLQTFTSHYTMSHWSWHSFPIPEGLDVSQFEGVVWDFYGRKVRLDDRNQHQTALIDWMAGNPHRFNLGRVGFVLRKANGETAVLADLTNTRQELDLWTGIITSRFQLEQVPVEVKTICHADRDAIAVEVVSPLIASGQLEVEISFPYPDHSREVKNTYDNPEAHRSALMETGLQSGSIRREMDDVRYNVYVNWELEAQLQAGDTPHLFRLTPGKQERMAFVCAFENHMDNTGNANKANTGAVSDGKLSDLDVAACEASSIAGWQAYWESGAAIDLSGSVDPRWEELERRVVLSQYLMKANEAGSWPPQESGLVNNGWWGRFHFEMIWWHGVHYALWDRWDLFDKSLHVFPDFLPTSMARAQKQGFKGARWPKCTGDFDRDWPHTIHATLIWQQPHPIYFAELDYRLHPSPETLEKWKDVVFASADFMADFAHYDEANDRYVLGPPVFIVSENTDPKITINPTFELGYWRFGLRLAQIWQERLGQPRVAQWDEVLSKLAPLPVEDGVYVTYEGIPDMWTNYTWEHPGLTGVFGMLPGDGVDTAVFTHTLNKVFAKWDFNRTWGWDFPMVAMAAARSGNPEMAVNMLLHESKGFQFDEHGLATGGPFPYFPSNGGLLTAVAMMAAGWDGCPDENAPGFSKGQWVVKHEGFKKMP